MHSRYGLWTVQWGLSICSDELREILLLHVISEKTGGSFQSLHADEPLEVIST